MKETQPSFEQVNKTQYDMLKTHREMTQNHITMNKNIIASIKNFRFKLVNCLDKWQPKLAQVGGLYVTP